MAVITDLPCEIMVHILGALGHVRALSPARLVCRHFEASFRENRTRVLRNLLQTQIHEELLPYAIALEIDKPAIGSSSLTNLIQTIYEKPEGICSQLDQLPVEKLYSISRTHEAIEVLVGEFSQLAWLFALTPPFRPGYSLPEAYISATENARIFRAFYRVELFLRIYGQALEDPESEVPRSDGPIWFYGQHNPWECHQILAVYEFLDDTISIASDRLAKSSLSGTGAALYYQFAENVFSIAAGLRHVHQIRKKFPSSASSQEMESAFSDMVVLPWLDPLATRHNCDLSGYSDHNDSLMTGLPRSNPDYSYRDNAIKENWTATYSHRQGTPHEGEMRLLRKAGFVFWDQPCKERELCPMTSIFNFLSTQAEGSDGSEFDFDEDMIDALVA
ncbi:unnamed protein product [Clonostachys rosea]|uniref:F-box domain-containing protein n=1 Tax=Bionectria ochroleuca TaxID=29856 RepID=A0ABY6UI51_BIOOC|nr:unnamed protein product [Clonostachys rosea]